MTKGRHTKLVGMDNRRCSKCKKLAKDFLDGEYLCRVHSPIRDGFIKEDKNGKRKQRKN